MVLGSASNTGKQNLLFLTMRAKNDPQLSQEVKKSYQYRNNPTDTPFHKEAFCIGASGGSVVRFGDHAADFSKDTNSTHLYTVHQSQVWGTHAGGSTRNDALLQAATSRKVFGVIVDPLEFIPGIYKPPTNGYKYYTFSGASISGPELMKQSQWTDFESSFAKLKSGVCLSSSPKEDHSETWKDTMHLSFTAEPVMGSQDSHNILSQYLYPEKFLEPQIEKDFEKDHHELFAPIDTKCLTAAGHTPSNVDLSKHFVVSGQFKEH